MDEYIKYLQKIGENTDEVIGEAVYAMANVVADNIKSAIEALPVGATEAQNIQAWKKGEKSKLTKEEKQGLIEGFGISPMQNDNGFVNVKLGFDGYNAVKTKKYPKGHPNVLVARITESGSSFRDKDPFIRTSVSKSKNEALSEGQKAIDEKLKD